MPVHVVVNTQASRFRKRPLALERMSKACAGNAVLHFTSSLGELDQVCAAIASQAPSVVVLCGGDGSYMAGITSLVHAYGDRPLPALSLAPGGSSCTVARNFGHFMTDPVDHVARLIERHGKPNGSLGVKRATLSVSGPTMRSRVGFIFGGGMVTSFFKAFYASGAGGPRHALSMISRIFAGSFVGGPLARQVLSPVPCKLSYDGVTHPGQAFSLIVSSTVPDLGLRLLVPHRAGEDPRRPHLVASTMGARESGLQYGRVLQGKPLMGPRHVDLLVSEFRVDFPPGGAFVLDGDLFETSSVTVKAGPEVRVVTL